MKNHSAATPDPSVIFLTSFVYFVQGALALSAVALPLFLRQKGWGISEIATFSFVSGLPWTLKIFYGALSDGLPLWGFRRKSYVILASALSVGGWLGFSLAPAESIPLYAFAILANIGFAVTDVVTDALIVENSTDLTTQFYQSLAWGVRSGGAIVGGFLGGWLAQHFPYQAIFALMATLPLLTLFAGLLIHESPRSRKGVPADCIVPLRESLKIIFRGDHLWFSAFLMVGALSASFSTPFFFYLKDQLRFSETFLGSLTSLAWAGAIAGCFLYGKLFKGVSLKKTLQWAVWLNVISTLSAFGMVNHSTAMVLSYLGGVVGYLSLLPLLGTAAVLSRQKGIEGSLFALLMSIYNLGQIFSNFIGGRLFDIIGLAPLIGLSAVTPLIGLFFIHQLKTLKEN